LYFTDRGLEELAERRGGEAITLEWLAERLRDFLDLYPEFEVAVERFATWLARLEDDPEV
jgi:DNA-binding transcriptional LysR family regulator